MKYWEDFSKAQKLRHGPFEVSSELLDTLLDLLGENHPVHTDDEFARITGRSRRIVPGSVIHAVVNGLHMRYDGPAAVIGMRSTSWDFVRPMYPDEPHWLTIRVDGMSEVDELRGQVDLTCRVLDADGRVCTVSRTNALVFRRAAALGAVPSDGSALRGAS
ncbi:MaoC family dehydratase [Streptomyces sp. NPDC005900]|uniref:MaoC family dehydratase n=1 Tax=Streptomyces sp. NPDC005900 TaxID=3154569 RepID=UPI0033F23E8A